MRRNPRPTQPKASFSLASPVFVIRTMSKSKGFKDRKAVVVRLTSEMNIAFYQSTGTGTPGLVEEGEWTPFNGISRMYGGWFTKTKKKKAEGIQAEASAWLARLDQEGVLLPVLVVDEREFPALQGRIGADGTYPFARAVNDILAEHGAIQPEHGKAGFEVQTSNVSPKHKDLLAEARRDKRYAELLRENEERLEKAQRAMEAELAGVPLDSVRPGSIPSPQDQAVVFNMKGKELTEWAKGTSVEAAAARWELARRAAKAKR